MVLRMKSYKNKKKRTQKRKTTYPLTGYVIYGKDSTLRKSFEWIIIKGGISKTLDDSVTYADCYRNSAGANAVITRLTWGHTDCDNCKFRIIPIPFDSQESTVLLKTVLEKSFIYE